MELFDRLELMTKDRDARAALRPAFKRLNLNLWLSFGGGRDGKRKVRRLRGGVLTAADQPLRRVAGGVWQNEHVLRQR